MELREYVVHTENEILGFFGPYRFLSNFHKCPVYFEGVLYPSTENAFMAAKTLDIEQRKQFVHIEPNEAKALGRKINLRSNCNLFIELFLYSISRGIVKLIV